MKTLHTWLRTGFGELTSRRAMSLLEWPQIARALGLSVKTVHNYVSRILDKLQLADGPRLPYMRDPKIGNFGLCLTRAT